MESKKILLIGGTGTISSSITKMLAKDEEIETVVLNRGHKEIPEGAKQIVCDANDTEALMEAVKDEEYAAVLDFIVYTPEQAKQRIDVFKGKTAQYVFISTVVALNHEDTLWLNENSAQGNEYSAYGRSKQACEEVFMEAYEKDGFPVTIVRPSQTYGYDRVPLSVKGKTCWSVVSRILNEKPVIVHGDGKAIWHMMHTYDFAYNFVQLIGNEETIGQSVNLVNPAVVTWDMIYNELARQLGREAKIIHIASDTLARSSKYNLKESIVGDKQYSNMYSKRNISEYIPDFKCLINMQKGIEMYLKYMDENPELKVEDPEFDTWCDKATRDYRAFMKIFGERY